MKLLHSKLSHPELSGLLIDRPRLTDKILKAKDANLFLLVAPAGYGKTVLVMQTLKLLRGIRWAWYNVDGQDCKPERFLNYLTEALSRVNQLVKNSGIAASEHSAGVSAEQLEDNLCCVLQEYSGPEYWLVLDNCESIVAHERIWRILEQVCNNSAGKLKVIVNSRVMPPMKLESRMRHGGGLMLTDREMSLTMEEFLRVVRLHFADHVSDQALRELWETTSGWFMGVSLILEKIRHYAGKEINAKISEVIATADNIKSYVQNELLSDLDEDFIEAILKCSLLDDLSHSSCCKLLGGDKAADRFLASLKKSMIPHLVLANNAGIQLHPLVRQVVRRLLPSELSQSELKATYRLTSSIYRSQGEGLRAIDLLLEAADYESALIALCDMYYHKGSTLSLDTVGTLLSRIPDSLRDHPRFIQTKAMYLSVGGRHVELTAYLDGKLDQLDRGDVSAYVSVWLQKWQGILFTSRKPVYARFSADWTELRKEVGAIPDDVLGRAENHLAQAAHRDHLLDAAIDHLKRALALVSQENAWGRAIFRTNVGICHNYNGDFDLALSEFHSSLNVSTENRLYSSQRVSYSNMAHTYLWLGQFAKAIETASLCEEVMDRNSMECHHCRLESLMCRGKALWNLAQRDQAISTLESALLYAERTNHSDMNQVAAALHHCRFLSNSIRSRPKGNLTLDTSFPESIVLHAHFAVEDKDFKRLRALTDSLLRHRTKPKIWDITAHFLKAYWGSCTSHRELAKAHLEKGLELMNMMGTWTYESTSDLLTSFVIAKSVRFNILPKTALKLGTGEAALDLQPAFEKELSGQRVSPVERVRLMDTASDLGIRGLSNTCSNFAQARNSRLRVTARQYLDTQSQASLPPLTIQTLGRFEVIAGGRAVRFGRHSTRTIFQVLVTHHPRPVHKEVMIEILWSGLPPDKGRIFLRPRISELRKALDPYKETCRVSYIHFEGDHYSLNLPPGSKVDILELRRLSDGLSPLSTWMNLSEEQVSDLKRSIALYNGEFLPEQRYKSFAAEYRDYLSTTFLSMCALYSSHLISTGNTFEAVRTLERGFKVDPLWSDGVRRLMKARVERGELHKALRLYRDYEKRIQRELDLPPDEELREYFESLVRPQGIDRLTLKNV